MRAVLSGAVAFWILLAGPLLAADGPAFDMARRMGRGVNVLGYDGLWDGGTDAPFRKGDFALIRAAGFGHVRINLHAFNYMDAADRLDPALLRRLGWAVEGALAAGLIPVLDEHDSTFCQQDPPRCAVKLKSFWREMSVHFAGRFPDLVFELLNEPGGAMTSDGWNTLLAELLTIVRAGHPKRTVIVPSMNVDDLRSLDALRLPAADRNLIVTFHYYAPMAFTHQGATWAAEVAPRAEVDWGSADDERRLRADFETVRRWADASGRPIYLGEFGVYDAATLPRRARWSAFVAREAERHGWPWAYWQFDHDFALFDMNAKRWSRPLLDALIPERPRGGTR